MRLAPEAGLAPKPVSKQLIADKAFKSHNAYRIDTLMIARIWQKAITIWLNSVRNLPLLPITQFLTQ